jgi:hypothetical protein
VGEPIASAGSGIAVWKSFDLTTDVTLSMDMGIFLRRMETKRTKKSNKNSQQAMGENRIVHSRHPLALSGEDVAEREI